MTTSLRVRVPVNALVGEGPIWDDQKSVLWWIDILSSRLYAFDPKSETNQEWDVGQHVGTVVPWQDQEVVLALEHGLGSFNLETGLVSIFNDPETNLPGNRFNDGKCDPAGRLWAGTMAYEDPKNQGSLYRLDTDFQVTKVLGGVGISNGIIWSHDHKTMYYIDSTTLALRAWDYSVDSGSIANERTILQVDLEFGLPDGMAIDEEGMLWVAFYGGSKVCRIHTQTGEVLQTIVLPVAAPTACAFGDPDLDTLYITCAAQGLTEAELAKDPQNGNLFSIRTGFKGVPSNRFSG